MADETQANDVANEAPAEPQVVVSQDASAPVVSELSGVVDGVVEKDNVDLPEPVRERIENAERVVHEFDADGNEIGWHKEPVEE